MKNVRPKDAFFLEYKKLVHTDSSKDTDVILFTRNYKKGPKVYDASFILSSHSGALICST